MGVPVLVMGESGSGKSTSLRNFEAPEVGVISIAGKRLPFRKKLPLFSTQDYDKIRKILMESPRKAIVIDDSQYLMAYEMLRRSNEKSFDKFSQIAKKFWELIEFVSSQLPPDRIVYFLHHVETTDTGKVKAKTIGKLLDNHITLEGMFEIVLLAKTDGKRHWFETQSDGVSTAKSPLEMFPPEIDNDLKAVDSAIRDYWELEGHNDIDGVKVEEEAA